MVCLRRPSAGLIRAFLASQAKLGFTYEAIGGTGGEPPSGYRVDHTRVRLGSGEEVFVRAREALKCWKQFDLGWVQIWPQEAPILAGEVVAVISRQFGFWWLSACRIVHVVSEEDSPVTRFGFAYGTLPDHAGTGEERFLIEWDRTSHEVWYDILAFSRPHWLVARLGYPYMRWLQKRFGRDSVAAMLRAVNPGNDCAS